MTGAITLAFMSGALMLTCIGLFRLGFLANFLSHPVIAGFITASGILIAASQLKHILGIKAEGDTLVELLHSMSRKLGETNWTTSSSALPSVVFLFWVRKGLKPLLVRMGVRPAIGGYPGQGRTGRGRRRHHLGGLVAGIWATGRQAGRRCPVRPAAVRPALLFA